MTGDGEQFGSAIVRLAEREKGVAAVPNVPPNQAGGLFAADGIAPGKGLGLETPKGRIQPLGGISKTRTVYCREADGWTEYAADEHGFNNPPGSWRTGVDVLALGDSFTHGACVPPANGWVAQLRSLGFDAVSIGQGGNGPLLAFAGLSEYGPHLRPRFVLWGFWEGNDVGRINMPMGSDLWAEMRSPILRRYLEDPEYSQGLIGRQDEIDAALRSLIETARPAPVPSGSWRKAADFLLARHVRQELNLSLGLAAAPPLPELDYEYQYEYSARSRPPRVSAPQVGADGWFSSICRNTADSIRRRACVSPTASEYSPP